jgi:hypothetical protein
MMRFFGKNGGFLDASEKARRYHEGWLNRALGRDGALLRVPRRRVDRGGYSEMMRHPAGRYWAEQWWLDAIERADGVVRP